MKRLGWTQTDDGIWEKDGWTLEARTAGGWDIGGYSIYDPQGGWRGEVQTIAKASKAIEESPQTGKFKQDGLEPRDGWLVPSEVR